MIESMISGKSVAIVGSAKYLSNFEFGKEIDEHDIVVRINKGIDIISTDTQKSLGSRSDILYHCLLEDDPNTGGPKFGFIEPEKWKNFGTKLVVCLPHSDMNGICQGNYLSSQIKKESINSILGKIELQMVEYKLYNQISSNVRCKPNTGIVALYHLLSASPKKLSVYGFSFLLDGWVKDYHDGIQNLPESLAGNLTTIELWEEKCLNSTRHIQKNQWEFVKELHNNFKNFFPDPYMKKILQMNEFNRENFLNI